MQPFLDSTDVLSDAAELRARARRDGYLFFRDLVDRDAIRDVRRGFVGILDRHGWIETGTDPMDAITHREARVEGNADFWPVFDDFQRLESFHALAHDANLIDLLDRLFGEATLVHPRNIGRIMFPTTPTTPPHQDFIHIQGTPDVWTAWIPLGDVPMTLGGLAILAGSHTNGVLPIRHMKGAGGAGIADDIPGTWVTSPFEVGDAVLFHSHTVHKGLANQTGEQIRLSVDYRYQGASQPVAPASLEPHLGRLTWEEIYRGWKSARYQYYWRQMPLDIVPFDPNVYQFVDEKEPEKKAGY